LFHPSPQYTFSNLAIAIIFTQNISTHLDLPRVRGPSTSLPKQFLLPAEAHFLDGIVKAFEEVKPKNDQKSGQATAPYIKIMHVNTDIYQNLSSSNVCYTNSVKLSASRHTYPKVKSRAR
jgi:hypothetical protein